MKCWECKKPQTKVTMVHYLVKDCRGEAIASKTRDVCHECKEKLVFNPCHYVVVKNFRVRSLKGVL